MDCSSLAKFCNPNDIAVIELTASGNALHGDTLDIHLRVPSILQSIYGTKAWMEKLKQTLQQAA
jgi:hypothetical protein